ncbi:MAG TPA: zinc ribbon domain-containing protein [Candidatus Acidoferrales bacterium]|nr:zinc ribbon domain-containing protein [Candidatus Acidoferrales bacterium]
MAFCTSCGAQVRGAFCEQCGTPAAGAAAPQPQTPPPITPQMTPPQMAPPSPVVAAAAPAPRKTSPIVWILVAVGAIFVLCIVGVIGVGMYVAHLARNPGVALARLITAANPDAEVVSTDNRANTITIRNRKTGEEVTMSFDDVKNGRFKMSAIGKHGEVANVEIGGGPGKMPSWVPEYPGSKVQGNFTAQGDDGTGRGAGGIVTFESSDPPSKVMDYYEDKVKSMSMKVTSTFAGTDGGIMIAADPDDKRTLQVTVGKSSDGGSTIGLTFGEKR